MGRLERIMKDSHTLTAEEFKEIHNAKCELNSVAQSLDGIIHPDLHKKIMKALAGIRKGLDTAYKQNEATYQRRDSHYNQVSRLAGYTTIWSNHEVEDMTKEHDWPGVTNLLYKDHWGQVPVSVPIKGNTWIDLWRAADEAINQSGDRHHVYIESFHPSNEIPGTLVLSTGS